MVHRLFPLVVALGAACAAPARQGPGISEPRPDAGTRANADLARPGGPFDFSVPPPAPADGGYAWDMAHPGKVPGHDIGQGPGIPPASR